LTFIYFEHQNIHQSKQNIPIQFQQALNQSINEEVATITELMRFIQKQPLNTNYFQQRDKKGLFETLNPTFQKLLKNLDITHFYFINPDGKVLLRMHDYDRDGDVINRYTLNKAKETNTLFWGLEFGLKKNYTLRVVQPWIVNGELIGYLELGKEIDKIIFELSNLLQTEIYIAINRSVFLGAPTFVKDRLKALIQTPSHYIVYNTFSIPSNVDTIVNGVQTDQIITLNAKNYYVTTMPLSDVSQQLLGMFLFLSDVSSEHKTFIRSSLFLTLFLVVIATMFIVISYRLIKQRERNVNTLTSKLVDQTKQLATMNLKLQKLFDLQGNIVIISDGQTIMLANQAFYDFFGVKDLTSFTEHYHCLQERFIDNNNFFYLSDEIAETNWIKAISRLKSEKRLIAMLDKNFESHAFNVQLNAFEEHTYIVSLSDISLTIVEQNNLRYQVTHDKLTNALNREFFDKNIEKIITHYQPKHVGFLFCDIDHFKHVNDTYGHVRGDTVLIHFVDILKRTIRDSDFVVRWGGEEFLILAKVPDIHALSHIGETIRLAVEKAEFEEIGHITCSLGAQIHTSNQTILETIEQADQKLYTAKTNGRNQVVI
jgi:diguanylate cyclase (GGDEF)-like protein